MSLRLLLSGEGPTDMGRNQPTPGGMVFEPGPMAELIDRLIRTDPHFSSWLEAYSLLEMQRDDPDADHVLYLSRGDLSQRKQQRQGRPLLLPGSKRPKGLSGSTAQAWMLGRLAVETAGHDPASGVRPLVVAVLFHDSDGTRSVPRSQWQELVTAIEDGFAQAGCKTGVAMVPRPKSEAWLLCALKPSPYQHCDELEEAPGNDASPQALKTRLKAINDDNDPSSAEQADWVREGRIDPARIDMPSFRAFADRLAQVLAPSSG